MLLIPAIDLRHGKTVRLLKGDYTKETDYKQNPLQLATEFVRSGAKRIHIVDLDGAKGDGTNRSIICDIAQKVDAVIDTGGGVRTKEDIDELIEAGVKRVILGTVAIEDPSLVEEAVKAYPNNITVGVDAKDGIVKVRGWLEGSGKQANVLIEEMISKGIDEIIYTDIDRDGTLEGPNYAAYEALCKLPVKIIASGGVSSLADLKRLKSLPLYGVIVGKALYEGKFTVEEALEVLE